MNRQRTANIQAVRLGNTHIDPVWASVASHLGLPAQTAAIARQPWRWLNLHAQGRIRAMQESVEHDVSRFPSHSTPHLSRVA